MRYWKKYKEDKGLKADRDVSVGLVVATYNQTHQLDCLIQSLQAQTHRNFRVFVVHDGPWLGNQLLDLQFRHSHDDRFVFMNTPERKNVFGHNCRRAGFAVLDETVINYAGTCNGDVYYAPTYFEWMLAEIDKRGASFVYCNCVHSHKMWQPMKTALLRGRIDVGCWIADSVLAVNTPFGDEFHADWLHIEAMTKGLPKKEIAKVDGFLYVHN